MFRRQTTLRTPARSRPRTSAPGALPLTAPWSWAWSGALLGLVLALLLNAPARWLAAAVQQGLQERVLLVDARGTVWNGSARLTLTGGAGSIDAATLPGRLTWRLS
jgi:general secretion pathway protein N